MAAESNEARLARLRVELAQARATRDRMELNGQSASFGGVNFSGVQYTEILKRVSRLEAQVDGMQAIVDEVSIRPGQNLLNIVCDQ